MPQSTIDLTGTHIAIGAALHRMFFSHISYAVYALILLVVGVALWFTGGSAALVVAVALLFFPLVAFHMFLERTFVAEDCPARWKKHDADSLSFDVIRQLKNTRSVSLKDLLDAAVKTGSGAFIVREMGKKPSGFLSAAHGVLEGAEEVDMKMFFSEAQRVMQNFHKKRIDGGAILAVLFHRVPGLQGILDDCDLSLDDFGSILRWESFHSRFRKKEPFWSPNSLLGSFGGIGRSWVMGYTDELDRLTDDLSAHVLWTADRRVKIHDRERENAVRILEKSDLHDLLIMGRVGVGKKTLVENITYDIRKKERDKFRAYTRVLILRTEELLSGVANPDQFLLFALKKAQESGRFILVIHNLALMLQSGGDKIRAILMKFIREENVQLIGIISTEDYHKLVKSDPALDHFFEKLTVDEASDKETMAVMMEHYFLLEKKIHVHVTYKALRSILHLARRYLPNKAFPGKAVSVLEDAMMLAGSAGDNFVKERHIREIVSQKGHIDVTELSESDKDKILHLDEAMKRQIVGQDDAVHSLVNALKRAGLELHEENRPLGTFLFLGPTGVGKTHTAKVLAEEYFGATDSMIRLDMNEFGTEASVAGITGSEGSAGGYLARRVQDKPFSLVLLDEIEKAHPKVLNLFLQILDEGVLIDHNGVKTDFRNTIIIATSNAGALFVRDFFRENAEVDHAMFKQRLMDHILKQKIFSPEFINRFDEVILYRPLSKESAMKVAILMLDDIVNEMKEKKGIDLKVEEEAVRSLVERGYSREFGAREMRRVIVDTIENRLANYMLEHEVKRGEEIVIRKEN